MPTRKNRIGETVVATNGQTMTIIAYRGSGDIDVRFEDGYVACHKQYDSFKEGKIRNPNTPNAQLKTDIRIGETSVASNGQVMTIIAYRDSGDIDVRFEDGYVACHKQYVSFKEGKIRNPNTPNVQLKTDIRIGETIVATNGQRMTIIAYRRNDDIDVQFEDGYIARNKSYDKFKKGTIRNPNKPAPVERGKSDSRIGETSIATNGQKMTIIAYRRASDIDIQFEDGYIAYNKSYGCFKKGIIKNPNQSSRLMADSRIGETSIATNGQKMTIIAYRYVNNIDIQFEDGYVTYNKSYQSFKTGGIGNPRFPMCGKGTYKTFQTQYAYTTPDGSIYFYCECQKCGWKKNLTAHEIVNLNHACEDTEGSETQCPEEKTAQVKQH